MLTLTSTLQAAIGHPRRKPAIAASVQPYRFNVPVLTASWLGANGSADTQLSLAVKATDRTKLVAVRSNGTALDFSTPYPSGAWTNLDTISAGQGFQLAYDPTAAVFAVAYGDGTALKFRTSADGLTWSAATTIVTEASNIGAVALAFDDSGDACVFYVIGTSTTLNRIRRTAGTWAASGTNWSRSSSVANLTGLAAYWRADYFLAVTGLAATSLAPTAWAVRMGDTFYAPNAWSTLHTITEADPASTLTFAYPSIVDFDGYAFATFQRTEAGNVPSQTVQLAHSLSPGPIGLWSEPRPVPWIDTTHGAALAHFDDGTYNLTWIAGSAYGLVSQHPPSYDISARILALSYRLTPGSLSLRLELDNHDGNARFHPSADFRIDVGRDVLVSLGYHTSAGAEYATFLRANIHRITDQIGPGSHRLIIEASGPWEAMDRYRALAAWTAPAGTTRGNTFQRVAALAGLEVSAASGGFAPSTAWTTDTPAFAIAAGEKGSTTLQRLLAVTPDFVRPAFGSGGLEICTVPVDTSGAPIFALGPSPGSPYPLLDLQLADQLAPNLFRLQGPDRYADSARLGADGYVDILSVGPAAQLVRDLDATTNTAATTRADNARKRALQLEPRGRAVVPFHPGLELFDPVAFRWNLNPLDGLENATRRIVGLAVDYRADPAPAAGAGRVAYTTTLDLAEAAGFDG